MILTPMYIGGEEREKKRIKKRTVVGAKSPAWNRTAMLFAPMPCPAASVAALAAYVLPLRMAVALATATAWPNVVVQPRYCCCRPGAALALGADAQV